MTLSAHDLISSHIESDKKFIETFWYVWMDERTAQMHREITERKAALERMIGRRAQ